MEALTPAGGPDNTTLTMSQIFTFAQDGKFLGHKNAEGFPKKKESRTADASTEKGMMALVEGFFGENFRDITARETIRPALPAPAARIESATSSIASRSTLS